MFAKQTNDLPAAIQAVLDPVIKFNSSHSSINRTRALALLAVIPIAAYVLQNRLKTSTAGSSKNDGPVPGGSQYTITVPYKDRTTEVIIRPVKPETFAKHKQQVFTDPIVQERLGVNRHFFRQMSALLKIIIPRVRSKEVILLLCHSGFLLLRTWLSIVVARIDGRIVRDLVAANGREFVRGICYWFAIAIPAVYTNSMIRYFQSKLSIAFRTRLTRYIHDLYLDDQKAYYKIINIDGRVDGADQFITTDVARFCDALSSLYSNLGKPILDTITFNYALSRSVGLVGAVGLFSNYLVTAWIMRKVTPNFGKLAAREAKLEGDLRAAHSRLITNAEEIAFYNGSELEHSILTRTYKALIGHVNSILKIRIPYNMFEDFMIKYVWSALGLLSCAVPVFYPEWGGHGGRSEIDGDIQQEGKEKDRTKAFITNKRLMLTLADAGGRMMYSYKELAELAGYTSRVYTLLYVLHCLHENKYEPTPRPDDLGRTAKFYSLGDIRGVVNFDYNGIKFKNVPIVAPNPGNARGGEELIKGLNVTVNPGEHLMITGPNGVGKTSIARVIATLWPLFDGELSRPNARDIFYIPQRPYLSIGSLRDQLIYPHSHADMIRAGRGDDELLEILSRVHLEYILDSQGGWDVRKEWKDVFSGGEKQRIGICRLFYHRPKFAILDECTSAVSTDVEGLMYEHAKDIGITLITISHRPALTKYHTHLLSITGENGTWEFSTIGTPEERMSYDKEVSALEAKLREVEVTKTRLAEINQELQLGVVTEATKIKKRGL